MSQVSFDGQVAIVTGAGGGMGREMVLLLARRGAHVVVNDYGGGPSGDAGTSDRAEAVAQEIRDAGGSAVANASAVGSAASARAICDTALEHFGRIDVLINNAGVLVGGRIDQASDADLIRINEINYLGPFRLIQAAWPTMERQGYGRILNVSSNVLAGATELSLYGASKAALIGVTSNAAQDGAPLGILVNTLLPAAWTRLVSAEGPAGKSHTAASLKWMSENFAPAKVAAAAVALVSKEMTGSGGHYSAGAGRIAKFVHYTTQGYFTPDLTPEDVIAHLPQIEDTTNGTFVHTAVEEMSTLAAFIPFPEV